MIPDPAPIDFWTLLMLLGFGQGLFLSISIFWMPRGDQQAKALLGSLILVITLTLLDYLGYWTHWHYQFPYLAGSYLWLALLVGPLFYLYLKRVSLQQAWADTNWWHFAPALGMVLLHSPFYLAPYGEKVAMMQGAVPFSNTWYLPDAFIQWRGIPIVTVLHLAAYGWASWQLPPPNGSAAGPAYRRTLLALYLGFATAYLFYYLIAWTPLFTLLLDYSITLAMLFFIYSIGYLGLHQPLIFETQTLGAALQPNKYRNSALTPTARQSLLARLEACMAREAAYLNPELRLPQLAEKLGTSPHHLSQAINQEHGQTFTTYVNGYRVREAQRLLAHPDWQGRPVKDIAYAAGFNNKTTFYKAFKAKARQSPTAYRQALAQGLQRL